MDTIPYGWIISGLFELKFCPRVPPIMPGAVWFGMVPAGNAYYWPLA